MKINYSAIGLILDIIGVIIIFYRALPEDIKIYMDGNLISHKPPEEVLKEKNRKKWAYLGLILIIAGFILQLLGALKCF